MFLLHVLQFTADAVTSKQRTKRSATRMKGLLEQQTFSSSRFWIFELVETCTPQAVAHSAV